MRIGDTIAACGTPAGWSARAVVRVSGPGAFSAVAARAAGWAPGGRGVGPARWRLGGGLLPALIARFPGPASYTGEDVAEVLIPGSPVLIARVLGSLLDQPGVRAAEPGEFSARAYLAGRLTLDEAEGVAATIAAQTAGQLAAARRLLAGESGSLYRRWSDGLAGVLALVEAGIDFTDQEDVVPIAPAELARVLRALAGEVGRELGGPVSGEVVTGRPRVVLAGAPNAGKSTLFNALLGRRRAVESPVAGTTRDALVEPLDLSREAPGAGEVELVDVAGLEEADGAVRAAAQAAAAREIDGGAVVLWCDPAGRFEGARGRRVLRVRTMADRGGGGGGGGGEQGGSGGGCVVPLAGAAGSEVAVCALDGWGVAELRRGIARAAWGGLDQVLVAAPRHRLSLTAMASSLRRAIGLVEGSARALTAPELVAGELRAALDALGEITGRVSADEVIGRVFAGFCVGK